MQARLVALGQEVRTWPELSETARLRVYTSGSPEHRRATKPQWGRASFLALHISTTRVSPSTIFGSKRDCEHYRKAELTVVRTTGTGGFGAATTNASPFGQNRPAFGAPATTTSGSLFGSTTATAGSTGGFGGFGNTNNNTSGGGLFGAQKPAFGGGSLFGSSTTPNTGFSLNSNQQSSAFPISSALGGNNAECQGTGNTPFTAFTEKEATGGVTNHFQSISFMQPYKNFSFEVGSPSLSFPLSHTLTSLRNFD